jgi:hypothetical protein
MPVIADLAVVIKPENLIKALRLDARGEGPAVAAELLEAALPLFHPRVLYLESYIDAKGDDSVALGGRTFTSRVLRQNLEAAEKAYPYLITVGGELETAAAATGDLLRQFQLETVADLALGAILDRFEASLKARFGISGTSRMSPGSLEDWPIVQQRPLFDLLGDTESLIGVRLTDSFLMLPRKSISGVVFPTEKSFIQCSLCPRENCQGRQARYNAEARRAYGLVEQ